MTAEQFVNIIDSIFDLLKNLAIPLDKLPDYIMQKELERIKVEEEVKDIEMKKHQVLQNYNITMADLEEYKRKEPLINYIRKLEYRLEEVERQKRLFDSEKQ